MRTQPFAWLIDHKFKRMTLSTRYTKFFLFFFSLAFANLSKAQCTASYSVNYGAAGSVTCVSTSTGNTSPTSYTWNFGNGTAPLTGTNLSQAAMNFTTNGFFNVSLSITSGTSCASTYSTMVSINNAPACTVAVNTTPATGTLCNGSASVAFPTNLCGGATTYSWSNSASSAVIFGCPGTYTVIVGGSFSSTNCCAWSVGIGTIAACAITPSYTFSETGLGIVNFTSTSTGTVSGSSYLWQYGDGTAGSGVTASHAYSVNAFYPLRLIVDNNNGCADSSNVPGINVQTAPCMQNVSFTSSGTGYTYNFTNTSGGIGSTPSFTWTFGDGGTAFTQNASHTYTSNTTFMVKLEGSNSTFSPCTKTFTQYIAVSGPTCNLSANFIYQVNGTSVTFTSTSVGTTSTTTYSWNYGDSSSGSGMVSTHGYGSNGTYTVWLTANNNSNPTCISIYTLAVTINTLCGLSSNFSHTVGTNGLVTFSSTSTGTTTFTNYYWNFGDGIFSTTKNPTHMYSNAGTHYVTLATSDSTALCSDTLIQAINITGIPCVANSNFNLAPTSTQNFWNATPSYPWNITAASWSWGDGTISNSLYTSHLYSVSAMYTICLSVTVSCGANSTSCLSYSVYKSPGGSSSNIININVVPPPLSTGINSIEVDKSAWLIVYPNPNNGEFNLYLVGLTNEKVAIQLFDIFGKCVFIDTCESSDGNLNKTISLSEPSGGIYILRIDSKYKTIIKKIVVDK
jgi:PKD repeat protein